MAAGTVKLIRQLVQADKPKNCPTYMPVRSKRLPKPAQLLKPGQYSWNGLWHCIWCNAWKLAIPHITMGGDKSLFHGKRDIQDFLS
jgi:hypothetical protein